MAEEEDIPLIQITNVSPQATDTQMRELFSYLGGIKEIRVYPESDSSLDFPSRVCFVKFASKSSCETALHLTNSILVDRALIVVKSKYTDIPEENVALSLAAPAIAVANIGAQQPITHTAPLLPTPPNLLNLTGGIGIGGGPNNTGSSVLGNPPTSAAATVAALSAAIPGLAGIAPGMLQIPAVSAAAAVATSNTTNSSKPLISVMGTVIPHPPPLTGNVDPTKIEEIRRTVYVGNLSTKLTAEQVLTFFQPCGEIKYVRMAGDETQPTRFAFVEFASPDSVPIALQYNGAMFGDRPVKVNHSKNAIVKPQGPTPQEERREVEEAMKRIKEANKALANSLEAAAVAATTEKVLVFPEKPVIKTSEKKKRSRSPRSRSRSHSRSRSRSRRRRSRTRSRDRRRSPRSRSPRRRSPRRRSRTPPRYSSSRYSSRRDYGYSRRSPSPRRRHRDRNRDRDRERERDRGRERERERRERERERERRERRERRRSVSGSPRRSPHKSRSSRRKEKREYSHSPSSPSRKHSKRSKKEKKKRHRRSPSYSASPTPTPSAESESCSPSPEPEAAGVAGSVSWGSEEEGGGGRRRRRREEKEEVKMDEGGERSSARESDEEEEEEEPRREESRDEEEEEEQERESNDSSDRDDEEMSDVE